MVKIHLSTLILGSALTSLVSAHPGEHEHHDPEAVAKQLEHAAKIKRGLADCEGTASFVALQKRALQRRSAKAKHLRKKRSIDESRPYQIRKRDTTALNTFAALKHNLTGSDYSLDSSSSDLFSSYQNASCILTPEVTYGPYYVSGEYYRQDVTEDQEGVDIHIEYQYIDVSTCAAPTSDIYIETWSTNATGVYAGVQASGNGDSSDATNLDNTFQRGVTKLDSDGVGQFDVLFPGHYTGRTTHTHLMSHIGGTVYDNGTYQGGNVSHVGQLFYDEDLITAVNQVSPYSTNTQSRTYNADDTIAAQAADNNYDPFPDWIMLGDDLSDGLMMWISIGIDLTASTTVSPAAYLTEDGGVANSNSMGGGSGGAPSGSGGSPPNGTMGGAAPSGTMGNGTMPSGAVNGTLAGNATATSSAVLVSSTGGSTRSSSTPSLSLVISTTLASLLLLSGSATAVSSTASSATSAVSSHTAAVHDSIASVSTATALPSSVTIGSGRPSGSKPSGPRPSDGRGLAHGSGSGLPKGTGTGGEKGRGRGMKGTGNIGTVSEATGTARAQSGLLTRVKPTAMPSLNGDGDGPSTMGGDYE